MSRFAALSAFALLLPLAATAQTVPPQGTSARLDVASWNIEWFGSTANGPTNEETQFRNVLAVLRQARIDIWAIEEAANPVVFTRLLDSLRAVDLDGVLGPSVSSNPAFDQRLGFVFDPSVITNVQVTSILTGSASAFGGRAPLQLRATVVLPDTTLDVRFIALHAKADSELESYERRVEGSIALKNYIDNLLAVSTHVVVLGDFNDELRFSIAGGRPSPYANFVSDPDDYLFATYPLDVANIPTYCGNSTNCTSGSTLDHVLITRPLLDDYVANSGDRYIELIAAISGYVNTTSDHLPVLAQFDFESTPVANEPGTALTAFALGAPYPNPSATGATVPFHLNVSGPVRLDVLDVLGRRVAVLADGVLPAGEHRVRLDGGSLAPGLYLVRLSADGRTATRRLVRSL